MKTNIESGAGCYALSHQWDWRPVVGAVMPDRTRAEGMALMARYFREAVRAGDTRHCRCFLSAYRGCRQQLLAGTRKGGASV